MRPFYGTKLNYPLALVLGAEGVGLRHLTKTLCDVLVEIPMQGTVQSLNVAQAASVVLFELVRRRMQTPSGENIPLSV